MLAAIVLKGKRQCEFIADAELFGDGQVPLNASLEAEFVIRDFVCTCRDIGIDEGV